VVQLANSAPPALKNLLGELLPGKIMGLARGFIDEAHAAGIRPIHAADSHG
jgi:hypothetical protein